MNNSSLCDEKTFYPKFTADLLSCENEVIIESPFITTERMKSLRPVFERLVNKGVNVYIFTRDPKEHNQGYDIQSEEEIQYFERIGVQVLLCTGNHHRKLAILDRNILWEGSLNILSQSRSREIMRRIQNKESAMEMFNFLRLNRFL